MKKEFYDKLDRAVRVASQHQKAILAFPDVIAVGAGTERKAGKITGRPAIVVTVRRKKTRAELEAAGEKPLPTSIESVPVDVVVLGKPVEAPEIIAAQDKAKRVLEKVKDEWLKAPNITALGIGYKMTDGEVNFRQIALTIFVEEKLPMADVERRKLKAIPPTLEGVVTDVQQMPRLRRTVSASGSRADRKDPLVGGVTVGVNTKPFWFGTLGAIVFDRTSGQQLVLSNQHVLDGPAGTEVVQPSPSGLDDSLDIGFQLDICNPLHFFRLDTPNTTVGSILAGGAAAAILAAALSDEIDPTRRGQKGTMPAPGAKTLVESTRVKLEYPEMPIPGTHFKVNTHWQYTRHTDAGDLGFAVDEPKENPHVLVQKILVTDRKLYKPGDLIQLYAFILPEECYKKCPGVHGQDDDSSDDNKPGTPGIVKAITRVARSAATGRICTCSRYHPVAILTPTTRDKAYPVVLREPGVGQHAAVLSAFAEALAQSDPELLRKIYRVVRCGCVYFGSFTVGNVPIGPWKHYLYVQTVNNTPAGLDPVLAATIIGGLPISQNSRPTLDVACGPLVIEDGQFDVELI
jgi:hypothetical protein